MAVLSDEQRMMRQSCRDYVDKVVIPFIRGNWQREWNMVPEDRLPAEVLEGAQAVGIRTLGVPEEFGGVELDKATETQTFAIIAEERAAIPGCLTSSCKSGKSPCFCAISRRAICRSAGFRALSKTRNFCSRIA